MSYRWCLVPRCRNNTKNTAEKLFVSVPVKPKMRKMWLEVARRDPNDISSTSSVYICEDHLDIEKDIANYQQYKMGFSKKILVVDGVVPSKFHWLDDRKKKMSNDNIPSPEPKRQKITPVEEQPVKSTQNLTGINEICTTGSAAKSLWEKLKPLRDVLRKQKKLKQSGVPTKAIKPWKYQRQMSFLLPNMVNIMRDEIFQADTDSDEAQIFIPAFEHCALDKGNEEKQKLNVINYNDNDYESVAQISDTMNDDITSIAGPSSQPTPRLSNPQERMEFRQQMSALISDGKKQPLKEMENSRDPLYNFFISMYETTKRMPPATLLRVRNKVFQAVTNMEEELLDNPEPVHSRQQTCSPLNAEYSYNETHGGSQQTSWNPS